MKITFLGTGTSQGVPVITCQCKVCRSTDSRDRHLRTSALVETDEKKNILIDIGPDFREQMLRENVSHLDGILVTHAHRDHIAGLDDIRSFNYVQQTFMKLFANQEALATIRHDYHYVFEEHKFAGLPNATLHDVSDVDSFVVAGVTVIPIKAIHNELPILGFRIGNLSYITDASFIEPSEIIKLNGTEVFVVNALRKEKHFSHFCLPEALDLIAKVNPRDAYITHMSHEMGLFAEVEKELPANVHLAYDGLKVNI